MLKASARGGKDIGQSSPEVQQHIYCTSSSILLNTTLIPGICTPLLADILKYKKLLYEKHFSTAFNVAQWLEHRPLAGGLF